MLFFYPEEDSNVELQKHFDFVFDMYSAQPVLSGQRVLSGQPVLSGHLAIPQG